GGVLRRDDLHRQRAQLHGQGDRRDQRGDHAFVSGVCRPGRRDPAADPDPPLAAVHPLTRLTRGPSPLRPILSTVTLATPALTTPTPASPAPPSLDPAHRALS